ncbi:DUF2787 family protein [Echinimonas agarilytica]|uniref:DUF2787 domain-containing protein n=1 Tax=Echinimonas agarilytica TaxID=1215918 RepID=A0AA41W812_9GAMM|nr:DUF2787 family protein [Echinimonas agarilytica]MCM2680967.1 DUF2787 domain-containing protein [Echinimonas agarilytica]
MSHSIIRHRGLRLPARFYRKLESILAKNPGIQTGGITLNFRDENYSAEHGGYHPVEIRLDKEGDKWILCYVTDFAYAGLAAELEKDIDVCFISELFYSRLTGMMPLGRVKPFVRTFIENFIAYCDMGVYKLELSTD